MAGKVMWGAGVLATGVLVALALAQLPDAEDEPRGRGGEDSRPVHAPLARSGAAPSVATRSIRADARRSAAVKPIAPVAPVANTPASPEPDAAQAIVEDVVQAQLRTLDVEAGALVTVTCAAPPRCLAEIRGPKLGSDVPQRLAEAISETTGVEHRVAASVFAHVQADASTPTHATFASFYPAGAPKAEAQEQVRRAVQSFKADLEAED